MRWCHSNTSRSHMGVKSLHADILKACGGMGHMTVHPKPVAGSNGARCFGTSSGTGMLTFACFAQS